MKVLELPLIETIKTCPACGTVFKFDYDEIKVSENTFFGDCREIKTYKLFINCPMCDVLNEIIKEERKNV